MWHPDLSNLSELSEHWARIQAKKQQLDQARPLPPAILQKLEENIQVEWTFHSNAIEGNTLTLQETHLVIREGMTVKGKSLREHFEAFNHQKAILFLSDLVQSKHPLGTRLVLAIHALVLRSIEDEYAGRLRNAAVRVSGANFIPPNAHKVPDLLEQLLGFVAENQATLDLLALTTVCHHRFVWIHPFFDGNGRTARLVSNLLLMQRGFPPAILLKNDRKKYYGALNKANQGNYLPLALLFAQAMERSLQLYLNAIPGNDEDDFMRISQLVEEAQVPYGADYISLLARRGKITAYKEGRNWYTSEKAVNTYHQR